MELMELSPASTHKTKWEIRPEEWLENTMNTRFLRISVLKLNPSVGALPTCTEVHCSISRVRDHRNKLECIPSGICNRESDV